MELFAREAQLACEACGGLALGDAAQQQHQGRWALLGFREDGPRQQSVIALAGPTAVSGEMALVTEQPPCCAPAVRARQPVRVEVAFQPEDADTVVQQLGDR